MENNLRESEHHILIFNPTKRLVAIAQSTWAAGRMFKTNQQRVKDVCIGKQISTCGFYFRYLDDSVEVTLQDLGTLSLKEYDELCGVDRPIYATNKMSRKGMKYKTRKKQEEV